VTTKATYRFHIVNVFTDGGAGGNPLAVVPNAVGLTDDQLQARASEFGLSETAFVLPPRSGGSFRLRIFTPTTELPFAGHPTIGSAVVVAGLHETDPAVPERRLVIEEAAGTVDVSVQPERDGLGFGRLTIPHPPIGGPPPPSKRSLAALLSLTVVDLADGLAPAAISCGVPFLLVPLRDTAALREARLDHARWLRVLAAHWAPHLYLFAPADAGSGLDYGARMFAPALGIAEDPATGGAAVTLAAYLGEHLPTANSTTAWVIGQGAEVGRPSVLHAEAVKAAGRVVLTRVGGQVSAVDTGRFAA